MFNGPIHVLAKTIKAAMASAMEAEMKALFMNAQLLAGHRQALGGMLELIASLHMEPLQVS